MEKAASEKPVNKWLSVPIIASLTQLLCRELTLQNEYLRQENKLLKSKIKKWIVLTDAMLRISMNIGPIRELITGFPVSII